MNKNKISMLCLSILFIFARVETSVAQSANANSKKTNSHINNSSNKKIIKLDYENDVVLGVYETPDISFINSRRMIKYKELFNRRTNFIDEIESNKGLFNEYQK